MKITDLLKWGLPLFFASTGVVVEGGTGDAAGGGDGSGDTAGSDGSDDGTGASGDSVSEGVEDGEGAEVEDAGDGESDDSAEVDGESSQTPRGDAKKQAEAVKNALNRVRETDPEAAKTLRSAFFKQEQEISGFRKAFQTPADARAAFDALESVGGEEGLGRLNNEATSYARELTAIAQGDASIVDELATDYPDGLEKLAGPFLAKLKDIRPEAYDRLAARSVVDTLERMSEAGTSVMGTIARTLELVADGKQQAAFDQLKLIRQWFADTKKFAAMKPAESTSKATDQREQDLNRREQQTYHREVGSTVTNRMNGMVKKHLDPYLRDAIKAKRGLTAEQRTGVTQGVFDRLSRALQADSKYQERFKSLLSEGDVNKIDRYVASQISERIRKAVRAEWHSRGFAGGAPKKAVTANGNGNGVVAGISSKPSPDQIDWSWDKQRMKYTGDGDFGEAKLKSGKIVKFRH